MPSLLETLQQDVMWYGQDGYPYRIDAMEQAHRVNVLAFLRRRATNLHTRWVWREERVMLDAPDQVFNAWYAERCRMIEDHSLEWLNRRPLVRALERAVRLHDSIDAEQLELEK